MQTADGAPPTVVLLVTISAAVDSYTCLDSRVACAIADATQCSPGHFSNRRRANCHDLLRPVDKWINRAEKNSVSQALIAWL